MLFFSNQKKKKPFQNKVYLPTPSTIQPLFSKILTLSKRKKKKIVIAQYQRNIQQQTMSHTMLTPQRHTSEQII